VAAYAAAVLAEALLVRVRTTRFLISLRPAAFPAQRLFEDFRDGHTLVLCCAVIRDSADRPSPRVTDNDRPAALLPALPNWFVVQPPGSPHETSFQASAHKLVAVRVQ